MVCVSVILDFVRYEFSKDVVDFFVIDNMIGIIIIERCFDREVCG